MRAKFFSPLIAVATAMLLSAASAVADPLTPDPTFDGDGTNSIYTGAADVAPLSSQIDAAGATTVGFVDTNGDGVARFEADGSVDGAFGLSGVVRLESLSDHDLVAVRPLADGNTAVAWFAADMASGRLVVLNDAGVAVDTEIELTAAFPVKLLDLDAQGRPVVAGGLGVPPRGFPPTSAPGFQVERFGVDGQPDPSWGGGDGVTDVSRAACIGQNYGCDLLTYVSSISSLAIADDGSVAVDGFDHQDHFFGQPAENRGTTWVIDPLGTTVHEAVRSGTSSADGKLTAGGAGFLSGFDGSDSLRVLEVSNAGTAVGERPYDLPPGGGTWPLVALGGESDGSAWATNGEKVAHLLADGTLEDLGGSTAYDTSGALWSSISPVGDDRVQLTGTSGSRVVLLRLFHGEVTPPPVKKLRLKLLSLHQPTTFGGVSRRGIRAKVKCNLDCHLRIRIRISRALAHRLEIGRTIGAAHGSAKQNEPRTLTARLTQNAVRAIDRVRPNEVHYSVRIDASSTKPARGATGQTVVEGGSFWRQLK